MKKRTEENDGNVDHGNENHARDTENYEEVNNQQHDNNEENKINQNNDVQQSATLNLETGANINCSNNESEAIKQNQEDIFQNDI